MLIPARQVGAHRTAGPILQNEPPDGGVSGGVGRPKLWPPEADESTLTASVSSGKCLSTHGQITGGSGFDDFRKTEAVIDLFATNSVASMALANVFRFRLDDIKSLMPKPSAELRTFTNAYRSPLAQVALAILAYRQSHRLQRRRMACDEQSNESDTAER
jgi:hypothetical protein